jgi:hypothetical protein
MADVRSKLASALDDVSEEDVRALVDDVLKATTDQWVPVTCKSCGKSGKYSVSVPDARARTQALQILVDQGLGKTATSPAGASLEGVPQWKIDHWLAEDKVVKAMSEDELRVLVGKDHSALFHILGLLIAEQRIRDGSLSGVASMNEFQEFMYAYRKWVADEVKKAGVADGEPAQITGES